LILYVDTSAFVPLLIGERTSDLCGQLWDGADRVVATRLLYVEAAAALSMAERLGRILARQHKQGYASLSELWDEVDIIELDAELMTSAGEMSHKHRLRGYDAVHCAAAATVGDGDLVAAGGDLDLLTAWRAEGLAVIDTTT
jgi:uncharacterized protein